MARTIHSRIVIALTSAFVALLLVPFLPAAEETSFQNIIFVDYDPSAPDTPAIRTIGNDTFIQLEVLFFGCSKIGDCDRTKNPTRSLSFKATNNITGTFIPIGRFGSPGDHYSLALEARNNVTLSSPFPWMFPGSRLSINAGNDVAFDVDSQPYNRCASGSCEPTDENDLAPSNINIRAAGAVSINAFGTPEYGRPPAPINIRGCSTGPAAISNTTPRGSVQFDTGSKLPASSSSMGPLRVHSSNPRYFADGCDNVVYLTGSHTHLSMKDGGERAPGTPPLDYNAYLDLMVANNHNFMRMWSGWELMMFDPQPWRRTGPGVALDGGLKFDLTKLDESYFERLRARVIAARDRNIYVSVMLFEGWLLRFIPNSAGQHPFNSANNINGINADANHDGTIIEAHGLNNAAVTAIQEAYVRKVIDTLNDLDNVLYEIANESVFPGSVKWQYHMINYIKSYEASKPKQHPVGMTSAGFSSSYDDLAELLNSSADWISPGRPLSLAYDYLNNPPAAVGSKVIISDSDHLAKVLDDPSWIWKSMTRGINPIFMDVYPPLDTLESGDAGFLRKTLGYARTYADKMDLSTMIPRADLASTGYALANPGAEYLVYQSGSGSFTVHLQTGNYNYEWFNPSTGLVANTASFSASAGNRTFSPPFAGSAVLHIKSGTAVSPSH